MLGRSSVEFVAWRGSECAVGLTRRRVELERTLFIQGSPRSGTTWLMEMATAALDRLPISEPFDPAKMSDLQVPLRLSRRPYRAVGSHDPALDAMLERLLQGRLLRRGFIARRTVTPGRAVGFVLGRPTMVKAVRAAFLLPYICDRFPTLKTVLLVRDPYSVISSQLGYPMQAVDPEVLEPVLADWPRLRATRQAGTEVEKLAVQWCVEHGYLEANRQLLGRTLILRYEDVVSDPAAQLRRVLDHLGAPWNPKVLNVVDRPSGHTVSGSSFLSGEPILGYKRRLDDSQIDAIRGVLDDYGHPFDVGPLAEEAGRPPVVDEGQATPVGRGSISDSSTGTERRATPGPNERPAIAP